MDENKSRVNNTDHIRTGGIKDFIAQTNMIGNVIAAAASQKNSFEPLPFSDSTLFEENYHDSNLRIHINPHANTKHVFLPKTEIKVTVTAERKHGSHIFHPYVYTLNFSHSKYKWDVIRTYKEIKETHKILAKLVKQDIGRSCSDISKDDIKPEWPLFPIEHDHLITSMQIDERCKNLADYLQRMLTYPPFRDHPSTLNLLGVSSLSFVTDLGSSLIEGLIQKRTGDNIYYGRLSQLRICCEKAKMFHAKRWFLLKDSYIVYLNTEKNNQVGFPMLVDRAFECKMKIKPGAYHAICVKNLQRSLVLKCKSAQQQKEWYDKIMYMLNNTGRLFNDTSLLINSSYAPPRKNQLCKWYCNSSLYMEHVMNALNNAKEEIYITDWWLCPELFLKRPTDDLQYRLDKILLKKSKEGVRVYILLFKEVSFAIGLLSSRAKNILTQAGKNSNIRVLRHPEHSPSGVFLWSHHEKCVIIDQSVAFLGGIDLCFGRWDDDLHRLVDLGRKDNKTEIEKPVLPELMFNNLANLANQIKNYSIDEKDTETTEIGSDIERTDTDKNLEKLNQSEKNLENENKDKQVHRLTDSITAQANQLEIPNLNNQKMGSNEIKSSNSLQPSKPDALLVAALMGNSITKFNRARHNRLDTQISAPPVTSPVFQPDTPTNSSVYKNNNNLDKSKSLSDSHTANTIEMKILNHDELEYTIKNNNVKGLTSKLNKNKLAKSNNKNTNNLNNDINKNNSNNQLNNLTLNNNSINTSNSSKRFGARASKLLKKININKSDENVVKFKNYKMRVQKKNLDLNVPTDPAHADEIDADNLSSKKQKVKRKWNKFKNTVKRKSHTNPLNKLRKRSSDSESDDYSEYTDSDDEQGRYSLNEEPVEIPIISNEGYYWIGKDYCNTYKADFKDVSDFSSDQFDRSETPRMPWRDQGLVVIGESARDLARHFIQRWNQCKREKVRQIETYPILLPKTYSEPFNYNYSDWFKDQLYKCEIQMTRSLDSWSGGISQTECSILNSYCDLINRAEHYIYIENQFFVTTTDPIKDYEVKNMIGRELVQRILRAHKEQKKFRVYVVLPLLPGFDSPNAIQAVQFYNLRSIKFGDFSIYRELQKAGISDPSEYITFHGMRNWSVLMGKLVQEIIYVHSKLMIVDDRYVICGSANVNDRSMLGKRDSEIAAVISDEELFESFLNNQKVLVGKYANSLRKKIFKLHLGIYFNNPNKIEVQDCVCDEFYQLFLSVSKQNTLTYDEVFKCLPSDNIVNFETLSSYGERPCLSKIDPFKGKKELEEKIKGFIVDFPLKFLSQEKNFFPDIRTPEGMVPTAMWT